MTAISIQKLNPEASDLYREIRLECLKLYPDNFGSNYNEEKAKPKLFFQSHIENSSNDHFILGAFQNQTLIGISGFSCFDVKKNNRRGRIIQVYVTPDFQGQKLGKQLVKATLDAAFKMSEIEHIEIGVMMTNHKAKAIYRNIGFEIYDIEKNYLKHSNTYVDDIILSMSRQTYFQLNNEL